MSGSQSMFMAIFPFRSVTNIYHKGETSEHSAFLFSMVCSKAVFADGCLGVPLWVGLSPAIINVGKISQKFTK